jgi:hypothetical protein
MIESRLAMTVGRNADATKRRLPSHLLSTPTRFVVSSDGTLSPTRYFADFCKKVVALLCQRIHATLGEGMVAKTG